MHIEATYADKKEACIKYKISLMNDVYVETILFKTHKGLGLCLSTQAGCNMGCRFCATGLQKNRKNLQPEDICGQVLLVTQHAGIKENDLTFITLAGMGEPLANYNNVMAGLEELERSFPRDILSFSTVGLIPQLKRMIDERRQYRVYLSLHSPHQLKREQIIPIASVYPLHELIETISSYALINKPGQVKISYLLLPGINDSEDDLRELVNLLGNKTLPVQFLLWNEIEGLDFKRIKEINAQRWANRLRERGIDAYVMQSNGRGISAACGQLLPKHNEV